MNAAALLADSELRQAAIARICAPVDNARASFKGLALVGHRSSIEQGEMHWALPGGGVAWGVELALEDKDFRVIDAPHNGYLREQQPVLKALTS